MSEHQRMAARQPAARRRTRTEAGEVNTVPGIDNERELVTRLRRVNLDLLPILHELLRARSVTRAARAFNMTQPAVSRALRQLRAAFDDPLLVSTGREARLSSRAEALAEPLHRALGELDLLLRPARPFDPASEAARFMITTADYVTQLLAPILAAICTVEAPHVVLEFTEPGVRSAEDLARIDFMIGPRAFGETLGKRVGVMPLWRDDVVCIAAAANRSVPARITAGQFRDLRQVGFQAGRRASPDIRALLQPTSALETGLVCTVPNFLVLGAIVETSDCVALVPRKVAQELVRSRPLRIVELVYPHKRLFIDAYWSLAASGKRGHAWFRSVLGRAAARLA
ncbi:MAG: LysR family transcriptional regulator [Alphaproteobacteria bacterium]|nr:LysR family transcriptional regulator [Alphaproteobacteria bacterium]